MRQLPPPTKTSFWKKYDRGFQLLEFATMSNVPWISLCSFYIIGWPVFLIVAAVSFLFWPMFVYDGFSRAIKKKSIRAWLSDEIRKYEEVTRVIDEPIPCLNCGTQVPSKSDACAHCGWSYNSSP